MRSFLADEKPTAVFPSRLWKSDFADEPWIAELHTLADAVIELLGPIFWAALIVLFIRVELFAK